MENLLKVLTDAFELAVKVLVPAMVWITVTVGLYQLAGERIRRMYESLHRQTRERYAQRIETGPQIAHQPPTSGR